MTYFWFKFDKRQSNMNIPTFTALCIINSPGVEKNMSRKSVSHRRWPTNDTKRNGKQTTTSTHFTNQGKTKLPSVYKPDSVAQLDAPSDWSPGGRAVAGSAPAEVGNILSWRLIMKYFLRSFSSFRWFKKGSCQFLAKRMCTILVNRLED